MTAYNVIMSFKDLNLGSVVTDFTFFSWRQKNINWYRSITKIRFILLLLSCWIFFNSFKKWVRSPCGLVARALSTFHINRNNRKKIASIVQNSRLSIIRHAFHLYYWNDIPVCKEKMILLKKTNSNFTGWGCKATYLCINVVLGYDDEMHSINLLLRMT